jgi:hypothetical protein
VLFFVYLLLFARHRTYHGFTADGRYLTPFLGLLAIPLAYTLQWITHLDSRPLLHVLLLATALILFVLSMSKTFLHIGSSYNYSLDPGLINGLFSTPGNLFPVLKQVFLNTANLPLLWIMEFVVIFLIIGAVIILHNVTKEPLEGPG